MPDLSQILRPNRRYDFRSLICVSALSLLLSADPSAAEPPPDFVRDVRPILAGHCFKCHGQDEEARKSRLRLDLREEALKPAKSGKTAIVPGSSDSELIRRISSTDEDDLMPPPSTKNPLNDTERSTLKRWIEAGAEYKPHWAFTKPTPPAVPTVQNKAWPRNAIDYFVLARLEKEGLKPSGPADKYTLVRRVYLDLIGLPPTPEQADAFVNDNSPIAYERMVDTLLASPHYGERWARRWLDLARYADTNGYEKDRPRSMWPYRDWVIAALNSDMPFDQFTVEQIAGDMFRNPSADQVIATGFHRNTMLNEEGGIDPLEFRFYSLVDRVHVTATTWLGLTMACAQCHTHKYDPIQHAEYYRFMAFLNDADEIKFNVPDDGVQKKRNKLQTQIDKLTRELPERFPAETRIEWFTPTSAEFISEAGADGEFLVDGSFRVSGKNPDADTYTIQLTTGVSRITHIQLEAIPDDKVGKGGPGRTDHGNFVLSEITMQVSTGAGIAKPVQVPFASAEADFSQEHFPVENAIDGKKDTGWAGGTEDTKRIHRHAIFALKDPLKLAGESTITVRLNQAYGSHHTLGRFRITFGNELSPPGDLVQRANANRERKFSKWLETERLKVFDWLTLRPDYATSTTPVLTVENDASVFASGDFTKSDTYTMKFRNVPKGIRAIRLQVLPDDRLPRRGPGSVSYEGPEGDFWLSTAKVTAAGKARQLTNATESFANGNNTAAKAIDDDLQSGWSIDGGQGRVHNAVFQLTEPIEENADLELALTCERYYAAGLGRFKVYATTAEGALASPLSDDAVSALLRHRDDVNTLLTAHEHANDRQLLLAEFAQISPDLAKPRAEIDTLRKQLPELPTTLVMKERSPDHARQTFRHHRGEFLQTKEPVTPGIPAFLPGLPPGAPTNRLGLAKWLVSPANPLTARVVMNRAWEAFFGRGIVRTAEDFGFQGDLPSHPELLDYLATEFAKQQWSQKRMHKLIVMSATYQQANQTSPALLERDPLNVLFTRGPRFRLDAEMIRDAALLASGLLSEKIGGPSVYPPQPAGVSTEGAYGALAWNVSEGEDRYRRGLYTFAKRTTPYAMTATFDGPSGEACLARRDRSNTPLQALTLLNDDVFVQCSQALGRWAVDQPGGTELVVERIFKRCLTRPPNEEERQKLVKFYNTQLQRFLSGELKAAEVCGTEKGEHLAERAAWTALARVLLNVDEAITKS
jgi:hypothetical protein